MSGRGGCPCEVVPPCDERCPCQMPGSSSNCSRCAKYGSLEQRQMQAGLLVLNEKIVQAVAKDDFVEAKRLLIVGRVDAQSLHELSWPVTGICVVCGQEHGRAARPLTDRAEGGG